MPLFEKFKSKSFLNTISEDVKKTILEEAESFINYLWPAFLASEYYRFSQDGDRVLYEEKYFEKRRALGWLVLASLLTQDKKYLLAIIDGIWSICEESNWVVPAHNHHLAGCEDHILGDTERIFIDLFASETGALLSVTHFLLKEQLDEISPLISKRMLHELKIRITEPYLKTDDIWWMGFIANTREVHPINNWNPWCHSNCLMTILLTEVDALITQMAIERCVASLEIYLNGQPNDGGCEEGSTYWGHATGAVCILSDLLCHYSHGTINYFKHPKVRKMAEYIAKVHIEGPYFVPFADCNVKNYEIPVELVYRFGEVLEHQGLLDLAKTMDGLNEHKFEPEKWFPIYKVLSKICLLDTLNKDAKHEVNQESRLPAAQMYQDIYLPDIELMCSRENDAHTGLFMAAKGNHNNESHNHNDVGNFVVYLDGLPVVIDVGVETYTKKTFSEERYDIWTMQSSFHNLPTINGYQQSAGEQFRSKNATYECNQNKTTFSLELQQAYAPEAGIVKWHREVAYFRDQKEVTITENFELLEYTKDIVLNLMTNAQPQHIQEGKVILTNSKGKRLLLEFPEEALLFHVTEIPIVDARLLESWQGAFYKMAFSLRQEMRSGEMRFRFVEEI